MDITMISKTTFINIINYIDHMDSFAENLNQVFKDYDRNDWIVGCAFNDSKFQSMVLNLLSEAIGDTDDWVHWWAYETDFGRDITFATIHDGDITYQLTSAEKLYDFLVDNCGK